jgi:hypothetical protein
MITSEKEVTLTLAWQDRRWHVRLYLWADPIVAKFFDTHSHTEQSDTIHTNLCPYMRTLLLWLPLTLAVNLLTVAAVITTGVILPMRIFGWGGYLGTLVTIALIVLVFLGFSVARDKYARWSRSREMHRHHHIDPTPGFSAALGEYAHKVHEGICPRITIERRGGSR